MKNSKIRLLMGFFLFTILIIAGPVRSFADTNSVPGTVPKDIVSRSVAQPASTTALQPVVTETGRISLSLDAVGLQDNTPGVIRVDKPSAAATVKAAYLAAADVWGSNGGPLPNGAVKLNSVPVTWLQQVTGAAGAPNHAWADVTTIVKPIVDGAAAGIVNIPIIETIYMDGSILAVIFDDPGETVNTVILLFGAQNTTGDTFNVAFGSPLDKTDPNLKMNFSLGISYGFQQGPPVPTGQESQVDVNGQRMTSSAGGEDDGYSNNGGLITVGGIGDSTANPPNPYASALNQRDDDELYDLLPFVNNGDTSMVINTFNPSNDDSIFFAGLFVRNARATIGDCCEKVLEAVSVIEAKNDKMEVKLDRLGKLPNAVGAIEAKNDKMEVKLDSLGRAVSVIEAKNDKMEAKLDQLGKLNSRIDDLIRILKNLQSSVDKLEAKMDRPNVR